MIDWTTYNKGAQYKDGWMTGQDVPKTGERLLAGASNAAPAVLGVTNFLTQNAYFKKIRDEKLKLRPRFQSHVYSNIRPVQGMPIEARQKAEADIAMNVSNTKTSDPVLNTISKYMYARQRQNSLDQLYGMDSGIALQDRARHDQQLEGQTLRNAAIDASNLQEQKAYDLGMNAANVNYLDNRRQSAGGFASQLQDVYYNEAAGNLRAHQVDRQTRMSGMENSLNRLLYQRQQLDPTNPHDLNTIKTIDDQIKSAEAALATETGRTEWRPTDARKSVLPGYFNSGSTLVPR